MSVVMSLMPGVIHAFVRRGRGADLPSYSEAKTALVSGPLTPRRAPL
jgi:hypothetical protein